MKTSDVFKLAFKALVDRKLRSALTIMGIAIGSAVILALIASSSGLGAGVQTQLDRTGSNVLTVRSATGYFSSGGQSSFQLTMDDVRIVKGFSGVSAVIPYYSKGATISVGGTSIQGTLIGMDLSNLFTLYKGLDVSSGRLPGAGDPTAAAIGYGIAYPTSGAQLADVNQMITLSLSGVKGGLGFLVNSILTQYGSSLFANIDDSVFIGFDAAQLLLKTPYFTGLYVIMNSADDVATVQQAITDYYGTTVRVISPSAILSSIQGITGQMTVFLGSIGAVSMFVAAVGITNTMFVSVMERTREIGVLKALGYRPKQIMSMFLSEAVLTGIIGAVVGAALGYALSFLMGGALPLSGGGRFFGPQSRGAGGAIQPVFSPALIAFAFIFPVGVSVVAGLYPAWRASRMNAVYALKYE